MKNATNGMRHNLEAYLDAYIKAAGIGDAGRIPFFRSAAGRTGVLTDKPMHGDGCMIQPREADLGMRVRIGCHTFRAPGQPASPLILKAAERWKTRN